MQKINDKRLEDIELFKTYAECVATLPKSNNDERKKVERKKLRIRNKLVERNRPLVTFIVNKYYNKPSHMKNREDLLQEGTIGLMSAIDAFDVTRGNRFSTYATWWIRQAVNNYLANMEPTIHVPSHVRIAQNKVLKGMNTSINKVDDTFFESFNKEAAKLEYTPKMIHSIRCALKSRNITSMETPIKRGDEGAATLKQIIPDDKRGIDFKLDDQTLVKSMTKALGNLDERKRNILLLRFNVITEDDISPKDD